MQHPTQPSPTISPAPAVSDTRQSGMVKNFAMRNSTILGRATLTSLAMVNSACAEIYQRWLPHVGEAEARREAEAFASRFHYLIDYPEAPLTVSEFDAIFGCVADAMAAP
jgi:hypothetical protein